MKRGILCLMFILSFSALTNAVAKEVQEVKSTQGVEIDQSITKTLKTPPQDKKELKQKDRAKKAYLKKQKQLKKLNQKKDKQTKNLIFLQHRLNVKEKKLEEYTSDNKKNEKGEKE